MPSFIVKSQKGSPRRLANSIESLYAYLNDSAHARTVVCTLLLVHALLLAYSAVVHSPTIKEPAHLVAGLSHWTLGRFDLFPVNPPLVRMIAVLPVMALGYEENWDSYLITAGSRVEDSVGKDFVTANGERTHLLIIVARWACIPFSCFGGYICYRWSRDLYGPAAGVLACLLWCFSPEILGNGALITPDVPAAALGTAACYTFWIWLRKPTWGQTFLAGLVLGLAELTKTTLILLYPLWPVMWIAYRWRQRHAMCAVDWARQGAMLLLRMVIGLYILNAGYAFDSFHSLDDFQFVSQLFSGKSLHGGGEFGNVFAGHWSGSLPVPLPKDYLIGIDLQQRDFEWFKFPSYLCGTFSEHGWWYYYIIALAVKTPIGLLLLFACALCTRARYSAKSITIADELVVAIVPFIVFVVVSSKSGFSHHIRYILPCIPFAFIWCSRSAFLLQGTHAAVFNAAGSNSADVPRVQKQSSCRSAAVPSLVFALIVWCVSSSLWIYPHSLSYFNECAGGPLGGSRYLLGSNLDAGQDLRYLQRAMRSRGMPAPFYLVYYGYLNPADLGIAYEMIPDNLPKMSRSFAPGWHAVSVNFVKGSPYRIDDGSGGRRQFETGELVGYDSLEPIARAGYSIYIYNIAAH
jgi:hypothetical protein